MRRFTAAALAFFLALRLSPDFSRTWALSFSRPALRILSDIGMGIPVSLLEWAAAGAAVLLILSPFRKRFRSMLRGLALMLVFACLALWYPLYAFETPVYHASEAQLYASCRNLIQALNDSEDVSVLPDDLPAKIIRFPEWMRLFGIGGLASFLTGEALCSPELQPMALPFVALHERKHLEGIASEGSANIAAWESCMERGGVYADSARLWALRYSMGLLPIEQRNELISRMQPHVLRIYRSSGGAAVSAPSGVLRSLQAFLGIENRMCEYEILALRLAADMAQ